MRSAPDGVVSSKKVANNTLHHILENGDEVYQLHDTEIVRIKPDGTVRLNSEGWRTSTTKNRINDLQNLVSVYQESSIWYIHRGDWKTGETVPYFDGIEIHPDKPLPTDGITEVQRTKLLNKKIRRYVAALRKRLENGPALKPERGDCMYCSLIEVESKKPLGDCIRDQTDSNHLMSHLDELYLMGSLCLNACKGYVGPFILHYIITGDAEGQAQFSDMICRAVSRYFKRQLGIGS